MIVISYKYCVGIRGSGYLEIYSLCSFTSLLATWLMFLVFMQFLPRLHLMCVLCTIHRTELYRSLRALGRKWYVESIVCYTIIAGRTTLDHESTRPLHQTDTVPLLLIPVAIIGKSQQTNES